MKIKKYKKLIFKLSLTFGVFFCLGFVYNYHLPQLEKLILEKIEKKSQELSPIRVWPKKAQLSLFPVGVKLQDIHLLPKKELAKKIAPFHVKSASAQISIFKLLLGKVVISSIKIDGFDLRFVLDKDPFGKTKTSESKAIKNVTKSSLENFSFKLLEKIPVESISLENFNLSVLIKKTGMSLNADKLKINFKNLYKSVYTELDAKNIVLKENSSSPKLKIGFSTKMLISENEIKIKSLKLYKDKIYFLSSGSIKGNILKGKISNIVFNTRSHINLTKAYALIKKYRPQLKVPKIKGVVKLDVGITKTESQNSFTFKSQTQSVSLGKFTIGDLNLNGGFKGDKLEINSFSVKNSSGKVNLKNLSATIKPNNISFNTDLDVKRLELRQLLKNVNVGEVPLHLDLAGKLPCKGTLKPNLKIRCDGNIIAKNLHVYTGKNKNTIVKTKPLSAVGFVEIDDKKVKYSAKLETGKSKGSSDGVINYKTGFNINYATKGFDLTEIENLSNLKLEGIADINGKTYGNSKYGVIKMKIKGKELWLEDYYLGHPTSTLRYKKGFLKFTNLKAQLQNSQYYGSLSINLPKSRIYINAKSQYIEAKDISTVFSRRVKLPFKISGTGTVNANIWGPLKFNKLSYDFKAELFRGQIFTESYDQISANFQSKKGNVTAKKFELKKHRGSISLSGTAKPNGHINTKISARNLRLEESELITKAGLNIIGKLDFNSTLKGHILNPTLSINGNVTDVVISEENINPSEFKIEISDKYIKGGARLVGNVIRSKFIIPFTNNSEFLFHLDANRWQYLKFLSIFSKSKLQNNFNSLLTGKIKLSSKKGGIWASNGSMTLDKFYIKRGENHIGIQKPLKINARRGEFTLKPFNFVGNKSNFTAELNKLSKNKLDAKITGNLDLSLLSIVTPLEELLGDTSFSTQLTGSLLKPKVIGTAFIKNAFAKIDGFDHPFENVNADLLFNETQIQINAFNGDMAEGKLRGQGKILINGYKDIPIMINSEFENINLNIPKDINTRGSGNVYISGSWFPYTLGGNYNISSGLVAIDFNKATKSGQKIRPSNFLPNFLTGENFVPLNLNLNLKILDELKVKNQLVNASVIGGLNIKGTPVSPLLTGILNLKKGGNIEFRENIFELREGTVKYENNSPEDPKLLISADTQLETDRLTYDVYLSANGKVSKLDINLSSSPALKEHEIVSLLALGITNDDLQKISPEEQAAQTSYQLGSALLATPLGNQIKKRFGVELKITSDYEDDEAVPKFSIKKKFSEKVDATASRTVGKNPKNRFDLKYKFNRNFSVIGLFESTDSSAADSEGNDTGENKAGIDLEYKVKFK